jgi:hypothetical protein
MEAVSTLWKGMSGLQQAAVAAVGLMLAYWVATTALRWLWALVVVAVLVVAAGGIAKLSMPNTFCAVRWPSPIVALCS